MKQVFTPFIHIAYKLIGPKILNIDSKTNKHRQTNEGKKPASVDANIIE